MLQKDLRAFIELLNSSGVEYVVVGGFALAFHGRPQYTGYPPNRIDLLTSISGVDNTDAVYRIKRATGPPQDRADLDALGTV